MKELRVTYLKKIPLCMLVVMRERDKKGGMYVGVVMERIRKV